MPRPGGGFGAKDAVLDFRARHGIEDESHTMHNVDDTGARFLMELDARHMLDISMPVHGSYSKGATVWGSEPFEGPPPAV